MLLATAIFVGAAQNAARAKDARLADLGEKAAEALEKGDTVAALDLLDEASDIVWREGPLAFRKALAVRSAEGFGDYVPRPDNRYRPGETMLVYAEPVAFTYEPQDGQHLVAMDVDLTISNLTGQVIAEGRKVFSVKTKVKAPKRDFNVVLSCPVPELRPGNYRAEFTFHDTQNAKSAGFSIPLQITETDQEAPQ
ncbi:hypothetical protein [Afifella marina]|nr:hypothetical protein [Afifella marina]MBK1622793.1 hypothetical protein [Afifella marina DSM 2698]MBK1625788.1 hypothetical protein [Afifella marina]MBK5917611.1 hypothetical protein [Afifella marina]RAI23538.1 hypothetical protein CH311_01265 [Afifella marina DSM 2698]